MEYEFYWGLPTFSMRNKRMQFGYIQDRVIKKLHGWKERQLFMGGKEVLIKFAIQSILTHVMSCFKLPDNICKDIGSVCASFWWTYKDGNKKLHWKAWVDFCRLNIHGGMGFRDIIAFNQALYGKQVWRLIEKPHSVVARI
ncbi:hypothetical protein UlMin_022491 [Ulmus minor]